MDRKEGEFADEGLDELAGRMREALLLHFEHVDVSVCEVCPDFRDEFGLAFAGLGSDECAPSLVDVGGVRNLQDPTKRRTTFSLLDVARESGHPCLLGASAASVPFLGHNAELIPCEDTRAPAERTTRVSFIVNDDGADEQKAAQSSPPYRVRRYASSDIGFLGNLFGCDGKRGPAIRVHVRSRTSDEPSFTNAIRKELARGVEKPSDHVGVGGVFVVKRGKLRIHVMPCQFLEGFSTEEEIGDWLRYFEIDGSGAVCLTTFATGEPPSSATKPLGLRLEHTHFWESGTAGGHYHGDTTPDEIEYLAFFRPTANVLKLD